MRAMVFSPVLPALAACAVLLAACATSSDTQPGAAVEEQKPGASATHARRRRPIIGCRQSSTGALRVGMGALSGRV